MGIKLSSVATLTTRNSSIWQVRLENANIHWLELFSQFMFVVLHVLLNSSSLLNPVKSYHPCSRENTDMQCFAMHCSQWCRGSFKSVGKILGVSYPPLLHWCLQFCMSCSTTRYYWTLTTSTLPHSREYTDVQPFAMHRFRGGRASLNWFIIILGVSCPPLLHWYSQYCICCSIASHC